MVPCVRCLAQKQNRKPLCYMYVALPSTLQEDYGLLPRLQVKVYLAMS